jgi:SAM-dependent methyltransferase
VSLQLWDDTLASLLPEYTGTGPVRRATSPESTGSAASSLVLRGDDGSVREVDLPSWSGRLDAADRQLVARVVRARGASLDIGCGPGRFTAALADAGLQALGIDVAPAAVALTRRRGGSASARSVFQPLPLHGRWQHVLLIDGNIGIGGDPQALLRRCADLLAPAGRLHVELASPGAADRRGLVRLERTDISGHTTLGDWFPWAELAVSDVAATVSAVGLRVAALWNSSARWFAELAPDRA